MNRFLMLSALLAAATAADAQPTAGEPGRGFEVERYAVVLRPGLATTAVSGVETIVVRGTSDAVTRLAFSPNALHISEATVDGAPVASQSGDDAIVFVLPHVLRKGDEAELRFRFAGTPARGVTAVANGIYSSYFACDWMVCLQDSPGDKADLTLDLFLPAGVESVAVGRAGPKVALPGDLVRHRWRSRQPYSPYLYAFAAGPFACRSVESVAGELVYLDGTGTGADLTALFAQAPAIAGFLADKAGMPFPDRRYDQLLVPGSEAQEAASFSLIGNTELDAERDDPSSAWIVAHEMAHQWWGNLVTCATWRDFWLNEGMATFMVAAREEHGSGEAAYRQELDIARRKVAQARELGYDKPLAWAGKYPSLGVRRAIQYSKGALFLADLRQSLGDAAFWNGVRTYTRRHAGETVTSKDFQNAMEEASGRDLSLMFAEWVYGAPVASDE